MTDALIAVGILCLAGVALIVVPQYRRVRPRAGSDPEPVHPVPTTPETHDRAAATVLLPVVQPHPHAGATEGWSPLASLAEAGSSPDLATEVELRAELASALNQMMADFRFDLDHIVDRACARLDPYWARVDTDTGEWPLVTDEALHRWMAGQPETAVAL